MTVDENTIRRGGKEAEESLRRETGETLKRAYDPEHPESIAAGADPFAATKARRKLEGLARSYRRDDAMEALRRLRDRYPSEYDRMPAGVRLSLGYYEKAEAAARELGLLE